MRCPYCGHDNDAGTRFCTNPRCGRFLDRAPEAPAAPPPPAPPPPAYDPAGPPPAGPAQPGAPIPANYGAAPGAPITPMAPMTPMTPTPVAPVLPSAPGGPPPVAPAGGTPGVATGPRARPEATAAHAPPAFTMTRARADPVQVSPIDTPTGTGDEGPSGGARSPDGRQGLYVVLENGSGDVAVGSEWLAQVRISNTGGIVERVDLRTEGLPPEWVTFEPAQVNLDQNAEQVVLLRIRPPHASSTLAGRTPFNVHVWSLTNPTVRVTLSGMVNVGSFADCTLTLDPLVSSGRRHARVTALITNLGNSPVAGTIEAREPEGVLRIHPSTLPVAVPPGQPLPIELQISAKKRRWTGVPRTHRLKVELANAQGSIVEAEATMTQTPTLPSWSLKAMTLVLVVVLLGGGLGLKRWLDIRPRQVPNVVNTPMEEAKATLQKAGFDEPKVTQEPNAAPLNVVVGQDPTPSSWLAGGSAVKLRVSAGPAPVAIPNVQGMSIDEAKAALSALGFKAVLDKAVNDPLPKDQIAKQNPLPDVPKAPGEIVTLTPSLGPETIAVPDLLRKTRAEVNQALQQAGLVLSVGTKKAPKDWDPGTAFEVSPKEGEVVPKGSSVTVSFAPEAAPGTTTSAPPAGN